MTRETPGKTKTSENRNRIFQAPERSKTNFKNIFFAFICLMTSKISTWLLWGKESCVVRTLFSTAISKILPHSAPSFILHLLTSGEWHQRRCASRPDRHVCLCFPIIGAQWSWGVSSSRVRSTSCASRLLRREDVNFSSVNWHRENRILEKCVKYFRSCLLITHHTFGSFF